MNRKILIASVLVIILSTWMLPNAFSDSQKPKNLCKPGTVLSANQMKAMDVLVTKSTTIDKKYKPADLTQVKIRFASHVTSDRQKLRKEAARKLEKLFAAMEKEKLAPIAISGYRSYSAQAWLFEQQLAKKKNNFYVANMISACPGQSEHQTGLAMDVSSTSFKGQLGPGFARTKEYQWLVEHAHEYGYVVRYFKGSEKITKYTYEPWHIRYVGLATAAIMHEKKWTLEEFHQFKKKNALTK